MSASYGFKLSIPVLTVFSRMTFKGDVAIFPLGEDGNPVPLERKLYEEVNKALVALSGKWKRGVGHVFTDGDPAELIDAAIRAGQVIEKKKLLQQFFTPEGLANHVVDVADIKPGMSIIEPSAGHGALAIPARAALRGAGSILCVEFDPGCRKVLEGKGFTVADTPDFLTYAQEAHADGIGFDRIVMNPPFTRFQEVHHVSGAFTLVKPGGRLVAIVSSAVSFRQELIYKQFRELVAAYGHFQDLPADSFKSSGTGVNTVLVVLNH